MAEANTVMGSTRILLSNLHRHCYFLGPVASFGRRVLIVSENLVFLLPDAQPLKSQRQGIKITCVFITTKQQPHFSRKNMYKHLGLVWLVNVKVLLENGFGNQKGSFVASSFYLNSFKLGALGHLVQPITVI